MQFDFDPRLDRRLVVVINGRLVGGAGVECEGYTVGPDGISLLAPRGPS